VAAVRLRDIAEIVEVGTWQRANEYLRLGWVLLASFQHTDARHGKALWYSLGWARTLGPPTHPMTEPLTLSVVDTDLLYPPEDERML
jgi:hypothetical protein